MDQPKKGAAIWGLVLAILAEIPASLVALGLTIALTKAFGPVSKQAIGLAIVAAQLVVVFGIWSILYFALLRARTPRRGAAYFFILLAVAVLTDGGLVGLGVLHSRQQAVAAQATEAAHMRTALADAARTEKSIAERGEYAVDLHIGYPGDAGRICRAAMTVLHEVPDAYVHSKAKIKALGFPELLTPDKLAADAALSAALIKLEDVRQIIVTRNHDIDGAISEYRKAIASTRMPNDMKRSALAQLDAQMAKERAARMQETALEFRIVDESADLIKELRAERGQWHLEGEAFAFNDSGAYKRYRSRTKSILEANRELAKLQ